jgi:hypothetical protein
MIIDLRVDEIKNLASRLDQFWNVDYRCRKSCEIEAAYEELNATILKVIYLNTNVRQQATLKSKSFNPGALLSAESAFEKADQIMQPKALDKKKYDETGIIERLAPPNSSALFARAVGLRALYAAALNNQTDQLLQVVFSAIQYYDIDVLQTLLNQIPLTWNVDEVSIEALTDLRNIYVQVLRRTWPSHIRSTALRGLADVVDRFLAFDEAKTADAFKELTKYISWFSSMSGSPDLSNVEIRATGTVLALEFTSRKPHGFDGMYGRIQAWGSMLMASMQADNVSKSSLLTYYTANNCERILTPGSQL